MSTSRQAAVHCIAHLNNIDIEDLQYVEKDLCFYELVSLGFLLYGDDHVHAQFVLQKLLVLSNGSDGSSDLLRQYATTNPKWKAYLVEALAIIGAKRVLRKLGFQWHELKQHYLPHIPELRLNVNPLLKALYAICERMTPAQAGRMVQTINDECKKPDEHLRFYDSTCLEIFLLDWLSRKIIHLLGRDVSQSNFRVLLDYFKLNEMDALKDLLTQTIMQYDDSSNNVELCEQVVFEKCTSDDTQLKSNQSITQPNQSNVQLSELNLQTNHSSLQLNLSKSASNHLNSQPNQLTSQANQLNSDHGYQVRKECAGIILIINQQIFFEDSDPERQHLLPTKKLRERKGTDADKEKLKTVFSSFGYQPMVFENLTHIELMHQIRETMKRCFQYDSLIVCILSHGIDGAVYGSNSIPVKITDIEQIIAADTMQGKPKMLIVQACQKDESPNESGKRKIYDARPDAYIDIIKAMSTVPGYASMRHIYDGTWFIQSLCDMVDKLGDTMHVADILISVTKEVTGKRGDKNEIMVPMTIHTLRNFFFLPKRTLT